MLKWLGKRRLTKTSINIERESGHSPNRRPEKDSDALSTEYLCHNPLLAWPNSSRNGGDYKHEYPQDDDSKWRREVIPPTRTTIHEGDRLADGVI